MSKTGIATVYRGIRFRSRLEATWAAFFDLLHWEWSYEPFDCDGWIPDFALKSAYCSPLPVLVEVKPIYGFDQAVVDKINAADQEHEVLLVGVGPMANDECWNDNKLCIGWLRGTFDYPKECFSGRWDPAPMGCWLGSESEEKNPEGLIGFSHLNGHWRDRITGCYDGGSYGEGKYSADEVSALWAQAKNTVQWCRPIVVAGGVS